MAIVLSGPLIGCWTNERANQRAAQHNYYIEPDFEVPGFVLLKLFYLFDILIKGLKSYCLSVSIHFNIFSQFKINSKRHIFSWFTIFYNRVTAGSQSWYLSIGGGLNYWVCWLLESDWIKKNLIDQSAEYETCMNGSWILKKNVKRYRNRKTIQFKTFSCIEIK